MTEFKVKLKNGKLVSISSFEQMHEFLSVAEKNEFCQIHRELYFPPERCPECFPEAAIIGPTIRSIDEEWTPSIEDQTSEHEEIVNSDGVPVNIAAAFSDEKIPDLNTSYKMQFCKEHGHNFIAGISKCPMCN